MDSKDNVDENEDNNEAISVNLKPELNLDTSESAIEYMLYILGQYTLAPSPLPSELISLWSTKEIDKSQPCEYCSYQRSKVGFPRVEVDFKKRKIKFVSIQRSCESCYAIIDLKGVLNLIKEAFRDKKEEFNLVYEHFLKVNKLKESVNLEPKQENKVVFQDLVSMAYSLNVLFRMRKSLRVLSKIRRLNLMDYGHFRGTEFFMKNKNEELETIIRHQDNDKEEENDLTRIEEKERDLETRNLISNLSLNYTRRVPSRFREVIEKSALDYGDMLSVRNILELTTGMRRCKSLTNTLCQFFIQRVNEEIKKYNNNDNNNNSNSNNNNRDVLLETSIELIEYRLFDGKDGKNELISKNNEEDYVNSILEFVLDNMRGLRRHEVFRLIPIFDELSKKCITEDGGREEMGMIKLRGNHLDNLTKLVLSYKLFGGSEPGSQIIDRINILEGESFNSLYYCNMVVNIMKLYAISREINKDNDLNKNNNVNIEISENNNKIEMKKNDPLQELKEYVENKIYEVIKDNVGKFTSQNIVELVTAIRRIGEPYPLEVINKITQVYVKHISQYSIKNMIKLMEEMNAMKLRNEMVMLNTLLFLPRKISSIDSFESVLKLLEVYRNYESEYLEIFMYQQIYQIYHKINPKYLEVGLN